MVVERLEPQQTAYDSLLPQIACSLPAHVMLFGTSVATGTSLHQEALHHSATWQALV